jgi:hypothetical protein
MQADFGPLPLVDVRGAESFSGEPTAVHWDYHQAAFLVLRERLADRIEHALLTAPVAVRARHLTEHLPVDREVAADVAWPVARVLLNVLEAEMAEVLRKHSVFFWMHVYRRIGVLLHPHHEDKTDPRPVMLVRQIVELAIAKHGRATDAKEIVLSSQVNPDLILGGFMRAGFKSLFRGEFRKNYRHFVQSLRMRPQWVIKDFKRKDFIAIFLVEGLAYQYWQVAALLRALGKGAQMIVHEDGDWDYVDFAELARLVKSYDERTEREGLPGSLLGTWFDEDIEEIDDRSSRLTIPIYNVLRLSPVKLLRRVGIHVDEGYVSNFLFISLDARRYLEAHGFLSDAFREHHGYSLEAFVATLQAIAHFVWFPRIYFLAETDEIRQQVFRNTLMNILQRGYRVFDFNPDEVVPVLLPYVEEFCPGANVTEAELRAVLERLTLTPKSQAAISLWSSGPRYVLITAGAHQAVDLQGVPMMLTTLFVGVAHKQGHRGTIFEEAFRRALRDRGFDVKSGRLLSIDGTSKELDAGVIVGEELFAFECVSVERPLDYEIGRPGTFEHRRDRLDEKVEQVLALSEFLQANRRGTNYDFTDVQRIVPLVVSPFVEWLWDRSARLWLSDGTPRILSANEALEVVERAGRKVAS